jgi:hypothetical protein
MQLTKLTAEGDDAVGDEEGDGEAEVEYVFLLANRMARGTKATSTVSRSDAVFRCIVHILRSVSER